MSNRQRFKLPANVSRGMFSDEYAVEITLSHGGKTSLFTDKENLASVDTQNQTGWLIVESIGDNEGNEQIVVLPSESIELGTRRVKVRRSGLKEYDTEQSAHR